MRVGLLLLWIPALAAGCGLLASQPDGVRPTLKALAHFGYWCDGGQKELGPPNGLYQWHCTGTSPAPKRTVLVEGNDRGVATLIIGVDDTDPANVRGAFTVMLGAVPPLSTAPWLADGLDGWTGPQASRVLKGVRVTGLCDATQCEVYVVNAASPIEPLPLP